MTRKTRHSKGRLIMKRFSFLVLFVFLASSVAFFSGCAGKADPNKSIEQVTKEAEKMSAPELRPVLLAYVKELKAEKTKLDQMIEQMRKLPISEIFSDKKTSVKNQLVKLQTRSEALMQRYQIYFAEFQKKGGEGSDVALAF